MYINLKTTVNLPNDVSFDTDRSPEYVELFYSFAAKLGKLDKIKAIKLIRWEFDCGLREAKYFVEDAMENIS